MKHRQKLGLALLLTVTAALCLLCGSAWTDGVASGTSGTNLTWTLDAQGALTVSGTGKIIKTSPHHGARAMSEIFSSNRGAKTQESLSDFKFSQRRVGGK